MLILVSPAGMSLGDVARGYFSIGRCLNFYVLYFYVLLRPAVPPSPPREWVSPILSPTSGACSSAGNGAQFLPSPSRSLCEVRSFFRGPDSLPRVLCSVPGISSGPFLVLFPRSLLSFRFRSQGPVFRVF